MKLSQFAALILMVFASSCSKSDNNTPTTSDKTWKLGTTTYTVNNYAKANDGFQAYDKVGNGMIFSFSSFPTADGTYSVVGNGATLGTKDVSIVAFRAASGTSYFATGYDHTSATIKVISASRLRITLPDTWVVKGGTDSLKLSATIGDL